MKTTLEISDPLLAQARKVAARDGETLRALVEQGLRTVLAQRSGKGKPYELRDLSVGTPGSGSLYEQMSWEEKRAIMYEGRGG